MFWSLFLLFCFRNWHRKFDIGTAFGFAIKMSSPVRIHLLFVRYFRFNRRQKLQQCQLLQIYDYFREHFEIFHFIIKSMLNLHEKNYY